MAKAKPAKSNKLPSLTAKRKAPTPKMTGPAKPVRPAAADNSPGFTGIVIGHAAGEVWGLLNSGKPRTVAEIKKALNAPGDVVAAAIGWLAREDKLEFDTSGKTVKIGLR